MPDGRGGIDYGALFRAAPAPILVLSPGLVICDANPAYLQVTCRALAELVGHPVLDVFPDNPDDPGADGSRALRASLERVLATRADDVMGVLQYDIAVPGAGGPVFEERVWSVSNHPILGPDGRLRHIVHRAEDVTAGHRAQARLAAVQDRFRALVEHAGDAIVVVGAERRITFASPGALAPDQPEGTTRWGDMAWSESDRALSLRVLARARTTPDGEIVRERLRIRVGGQPRWVEVRATNHGAHPAIAGVVMTVRDITDQHTAEQRLTELAVRDPLTGLANRRGFLNALARARSRAARSGRPVGVVLLDVDGFKAVNDSLGHAAGDRLLLELARRVSSALRPQDTVARLGGDELVVLAEDLEHEADVTAVARRIARAGSGRYDVGASVHPRVTLSLGVSTSSADADAEQLLAHADAALYEAKRGGRNRIEVFSPALRQGLIERLHVEQELDEALTAGALELHWQPIVEAGGDRVVAVEALLRWEHPERGLLAAGEFLPAARSAGLMPRICSWVVREAAAQAAAWTRAGRCPKVFVNLSPQELGDPSLPADVAALLARHGVDPGLLHLEVSERLPHEQLPGIHRQLVALRERGMRIALDDFGAGNTSLAWLQELPIDLLKLDRRFAATIEAASTRAIVRAVVGLSGELGIPCVAEGVQTPGQLGAMAGLGCRYAQGFLLGRPQAASELAGRLTPA